MGKKFAENDFFKDFGQKWKVRTGTVVFQKIIMSSDGFSVNDGCLQITWYNAATE